MAMIAASPRRMIERPRPFSLEEIHELERRYAAGDIEGCRYHIPRMLTLLRDVIEGRKWEP